MSQEQQVALSQETVQAIIQGLASSTTLANAIAERVRPTIPEGGSGVPAGQGPPVSTLVQPPAPSVTPNPPTPQDPPPSSSTDYNPGNGQPPSDHSSTPLPSGE